MAVVELSQWMIDSEQRNKQQEGWEAERNQREEITVRTCQRLRLGSVAGLMALCQHHYVGVRFRSGFTPDGRDIHTQTRVMRPPTPDTGTLPGPDTWSVVRQQVRQETDWCLLATCQSCLTLALFHTLPSLHHVNIHACIHTYSFSYWDFRIVFKSFF